MVRLESEGEMLYLTVLVLKFGRGNRRWRTESRLRRGSERYLLFSVRIPKGTEGLRFGKIG